MTIVEASTVFILISSQNCWGQPKVIDNLFGKALNVA